MMGVVVWAGGGRCGDEVGGGEGICYCAHGRSAHLDPLTLPWRGFGPGCRIYNLYTEPYILDTRIVRWIQMKSPLVKQEHDQMIEGIL